MLYPGFMGIHGDSWGFIGICGWISGILWGFTRTYDDITNKCGDSEVQCCQQLSSPGLWWADPIIHGPGIHQIQDWSGTSIAHHRFLIKWPEIGGQSLPVITSRCHRSYPHWSRIFSLYCWLISPYIPIQTKSKYCSTVFCRDTKHHSLEAQTNCLVEDLTPCVACLSWAVPLVTPQFLWFCIIYAKYNVKYNILQYIYIIMYIFIYTYPVIIIELITGYP